MPALSAAALLDLWDDCARSRPLQRTLALIRATGDADAEDIPRWPMGRVDAHLLSLREAAFGPEMQCEANCPACVARLEFVLRTTSLRLAEVPGAGEADLRYGEFEIALRAPTLGDLLACEASPETALDQLLRGSIRQLRRGGIEVRASELPEDARPAIDARLAQLDPQADLTLDLDCPDCGHVWQTGFDIAAFVWREIGEWVRRTLEEIHLLASRYGWSEQQILALPPARRAWYVEKALG